jgi:hypothetical protein
MVDPEACAAQATGNLVGAPFIPLTKLDHFLFEKTVNARTNWTPSSFFFHAFPSVRSVTIPPAVKHFSINLSLSANSSNRPALKLLLD